ncbi:transposase [Streptomyces sp. NPDC088196]|uniref:transposase n=1 Tax=Streptomyces sp. NPDC088196 TaxID=3154868 RepID=UPI00344BB2C2
MSRRDARAGAQRVTWRRKRSAVVCGSWSLRCCHRSTPVRRAAGPLRVTSGLCSRRSCVSLRGGCAWRHLPETFGVSSATAHHRFTVCTRAGLWRRLHRAVLDELGARGELDWASAIVDAASVRPERGHAARTPTGPAHRTSRDRAVDRLAVRLPPVYGPIRTEGISRPRRPRRGPARVA